MTKAELVDMLKSWHPRVLFAYDNGVGLEMSIDGYKNDVNWIVTYKGRDSEFNNYDEAFDDFIKKTKVKE